MSFGTGCILKRESKRKNLCLFRVCQSFLPDGIFLGGASLFYKKMKKSRLFSVERNLVCIESFSMPTDNSITSQYEDFVSLYVRHEPAVFSCVLGIAWKTADAEDVTQRAP
jgi:hypothetical protein